MESFQETFHITDATPDDFEDIRALFTSGKVQYFGESKRKAVTAELFFKYYVTHRFMVQRSKEDHTIIGYAEMSNSPYIPALSEDSWRDWLWFHYCHRLPLSRGNTFFFNTFIYNKDFNPDLIRQVLCEIFYRENKIRYVIVVQCPDYGFENEKDRPNYNCLEQLSAVFYPNSFSAISCPNTQQIHVIYRDDVIPKMRYRRALPEDNDDIVELVNNDRPDIKEELGEYYIAEELLSDTSNSILIVTEISHITAGFIWLNGNVDITHLVKNYDLSAFGNLIKFNPEQKFKEKTFFVTTAGRRPVNKLFTVADIDPILERLAQEENASILSDDPQGNEEFEQFIKRQLLFKKLNKFGEELKTYDYYIQLRQQRYGVLYNIPPEELTSELEDHSNVFVIQLFGLMTSHDLRRLFRYLYTAFAAFPERDYCLLSLNVAQTITPALFEMLKYLIRVTPRPGCKIDEHLYITHRSAVYGDLTLYPVNRNDIEDIRKLLNDEMPKSMPTAPRRTRQHARLPTIASRIFGTYNTTNPSDISIVSRDKDQSQYDLQVVMDILKNIFEEPFSKYKCFIIKCGDSTNQRDDNVTVGFVILRPFTSNWHLKKHFLLPPVKDTPTLNVAEVMILKLHPFFHYQADVIFRELARQANCWHFYHFQPTLHNCLSNDLITCMQPLEPRRIKKVWFCKSEESSSTTDIHTSQANFQSTSVHDFNIHPIDFFHDHFAAYQNNLCHSLYFGHTMNIVVIGFTDICKAFLRLMLFSWSGMGNVQATTNCLPHVTITVICSPGIMEAEYESSFRCDRCEQDEDCWVNYRNGDAFVRDVTERMDVRTCVRFVSGDVKAIDTDNHIVKLETDCEIYYETLLLMCYTDYGIPRRMFDLECPHPGNYVQINNRFDKLLFYHRLRMYQQDFPDGEGKNSFVIYGNHIRAFEFIDFLVKHGVKGSTINLVMPYQLANQQLGLMLNDSSIDTRVEEILREMIEYMGVKVYERLNLFEITRDNDNDNIVESVTFQSFFDEQTLTLTCDFFVSYCEKYMADKVLEVMEETELDTKGSYILVNENYQTSDPCVYAMGNFIKHHTEPNHQYRFVCPQEAAEKIISALQLYEVENPDKDKKFSKPYYFQAQLPKDHYYFKVTTPKRYLANHLDNEYGFPLVTYSEGDFTRVRLNVHGMVEEIVVVTKKNKDYDFLKFFCGRHELLLNTLKSRWYLRDIENFLEFFQEPWVELIMNDHFEELQMLNKLLILPAAQKVMEFDTDRETRRKIMRSFCQDLGVTSELEMAFLQFVREHRSEFNSDIALPEDFPQPTKELDFEN